MTLRATSRGIPARTGSLQTRTGGLVIPGIGDTGIPTSLGEAAGAAGLMPALDAANGAIKDIGDVINSSRKLFATISTVMDEQQGPITAMFKDIPAFYNSIRADYDGFKRTMKVVKYGAIGVFVVGSAMIAFNFARKV